MWKSSKYRTRIAASGVAMILIVVVGEFSIASDQTPDIAPSRDAVVIERRALIGDSERVRDHLTTKAQGHQYIRSQDDVMAEVRPPPPRCGVRTAKFFRNRVVSTFNVRMRDSCRISNDAVECASGDLPGYQALYMQLNYERTPTELMLDLSVKQRGLWGLVHDPELTNTDADWFEKTFDCLLSVLECNDNVPMCARRELGDK